MRRAFRQVDISSKPVVLREAEAAGRISLTRKTIERIRKGGVEKGDPVDIASLAAVLGAKKTTDLISLTHIIRIENVEPKVRLLDDGIEVAVTVKAHERTGVEMEALTGVLVALLNIWDLVKQYEKDESGQYPDTRIEGVRVVRKVKGRR